MSVEWKRVRRGLLVTADTVWSVVKGLVLVFAIAQLWTVLHG